MRRDQAAEKLRQKERADGWKMSEQQIQEKVAAQYPSKGDYGGLTEDQAREFQGSRVGAHETTFSRFKVSITILHVKSL